jgi:5'-3' exonuclease
MGIERFFSSINRNFNVVDVIENTSKIKTNALLIDFNSILHNVSAKLIKDINNSQRGKDKTDKTYDTFKIDDIEELIINEMKEYLINLFKIVDCKLVYIAFDGVPTFSKIIEQKKRRFIGDLIEQLVSKYSLPFSFNKSLLSPGTVFMDKVVLYLKENKLHNNLIISDTNEKGEGEFKILDYIQKENLDSFIIYSPDADLIILSMIIWANAKKNIDLKILRYDQNTEILNLIYINHLVDYLISYYEDKISLKIDNKRYINDLSFIFTVFGNDFLPRIEDININMDFYLVLDGYIINYIDHGYLLNENIDIIPKSLFNYLKFINKYETTLLKRNANLYKYQNFNYAQTINLYLDLTKHKFNPLMVLFVDYGTNLKNTTKYGKLEYYFYDSNKLSKMKDYEFKNNFNQKYIQDNKLSYQKLLPFEYKSSIKKHLISMKDLTLREKEYYLINNKLDKYYTLFNPNNKFFDTLKKEDYYSDMNIKSMVSQYLNGLKWLINYYFKRQNIDETWVYPFHMSPLLSDFVNFFEAKSIEYNFKNISLNITPIEQLLYITPIRLTNIKSFLSIIKATDKEKQIISNFIENNLNLFYNLDEIYYAVLTGNLKKDLLDCSSTTFISKCHYLILDEIKPIKQFKLKL